MNGISSCSMMLLIVCSGLCMLLEVFVSVVSSSGVRNMLRMFDSEVLYIVVGMLLCVIEVNVMDDCMVEGRVYRNSMLRYSFGVSS